MPAADVTSAPVFCPDCGYDLHGLTSQRCPECGLLIDHVAVLSLIPWQHRRQIGRWRSFWRTAWLATFHPTRLAGAAAVPVDEVSARRFRWIVCVPAAMSLTLAAVAAAYAVGHGAGLQLQPLTPAGSANPGAVLPTSGIMAELLLLLVAGLQMWPVLPIGIFLSLLLATAIAPRWPLPAAVPPVRKARWAALAYYTAGPLVGLIAPILAAVATFFFVKVWGNYDLQDDLQILLIDAARAYLAATALVLLGWWWSSLRVLGLATRCGPLATLAAAVVLPWMWLLCVVLGTWLFTTIAGLLWIMCDSLR